MGIYENFLHKLDNFDFFLLDVDLVSLILIAQATIFVYCRIVIRLIKRKIFQIYLGG